MGLSTNSLPDDHGFKLSPEQAEHVLKPIKERALAERTKEDAEIAKIMTKLKPYGFVWDGSGLNNNEVKYYEFDTPEKFGQLLKDIAPLAQYGRYRSSGTPPFDEFVDFIYRSYQVSGYHNRFEYNKKSTIVLVEPGTKDPLLPEHFADIYYHPEKVIKFENLAEVKANSQALVDDIFGKEGETDEAKKGLYGHYKAMEKRVRNGANYRFLGFIPTVSWQVEADALKAVSGGYWTQDSLSKLDDIEKDMLNTITAMSEKTKELRKVGGMVHVRFEKKDNPAAFVADTVYSMAEHGLRDLEYKQFDLETQRDWNANLTDFFSEIAAAVATRGLGKILRGYGVLAKELSAAKKLAKSKDLIDKAVAIAKTNGKRQLVFQGLHQASSGTLTAFLMNAQGDHLSRVFGTWLHGKTIEPQRWSYLQPAGVRQAFVFAALSPVGMGLGAASEKFFLVPLQLEKTRLRGPPPRSSMVAFRCRARAILSHALAE